MATELGKAYVQIIPSAQGIKGMLADEIEKPAGASGDSAGSTIGSRIKKAIVAAGIGTAIVTGLKKSLTEGANLEQSYLGGLDTLYGDAADKAREYARAAADAGISQNTFSEQAVSFGAALKSAYGGDTTKALEAANKAILDMTDNAAKMGTPIESIQDAYQGFAKQNYTMLDNLKLGYGGTKSEMERLLKEAQEISGVEYDINNLGDVYDAIHVIQGELGLTGVAADEAASTLLGSSNAMKAAFDNLMGNLMLGENIEGSATDLANKTATFLFGNLIPAIGNIIKSLPAAVTGFIQTGLPQFAESGMQLISSLTDAAKTQLPGAIKNMFTGLKDMSGQLLAGSGDFVDAGLNLVKKIVDGIISAIPVMIQTVPVIVQNLANIINNNAPKIMGTAFHIMKALAVGLIKALPVLIQSLPQLFSAAMSVFMALGWGRLGKSIVKGIAKGVKSAAGSAKAAMTKVKDNLVKPITTAKNKISSVVKKIKSIFKKLKLKIHLKVPRISLSGGKAPWGIAGKGKLPSFHVKWAAKGGIVDGATLIGAGEKGKEAIVPLDSFWDRLEASGGIDYDLLAQALITALSQVRSVTNIHLGKKVVAREISPLVRDEINQMDVRSQRRAGVVGGY